MLAVVKSERIPIDRVVADVPRLTASYGLASDGAVHAATALLGEPVAIVTTDVGFASLPNDVVLFTDAARAGRCRQSGRAGDEGRAARIGG